LDRSDISFVDNLLAKVADGEWTLGEGLVATLQLMAGEIDASSVLRNDELLTYEGTGIIRMAYEYLETGEDTEAKSEVTRLLHLLVFSDERLDSMTEVGAEPALIPKGSPSDCLEFFTGYSEVPPGVGNCLEVRSSPLLDDFYPGAFRIFAPAPPLPTAGWTEKALRTCPSDHGRICSDPQSAREAARCDYCLRRAGRTEGCSGMGQSQAVDSPGV
jgi:hypothetical protein